MTQVSQLQLRACRIVVLALVMIAGTAVAVRAATATWDRNIEADVTGYKLSYGTEPGVHTVTVDVGNVTTYQFNPPAGARYYIVVQAYNVSGELSEKSPEAILDVAPIVTAPSSPAPAPSVPPTNLPPVIAQPSNQTSVVNANVSFALSASDPEGNTLQFTATNLPKGLSLNRTSGLISGRVKGAGTYQVVVTVSDGALSASRTFTWSVTGKSGKSTAGETETIEGMGDTSSADEYVDVSGDFDGDGRADLATYRQASSEWRIWTSSSKFGTPTVMVWGDPGDRPVPADYNGDGVTDFAVYRPSTGTWHLSLSGSQTPMAYQWGGAEDVPVPLDHDGDGKADLALIRDGGYDILLSSSNYLKSVQVR